MKTVCTAAIQSPRSCFLFFSILILTLLLPPSIHASDVKLKMQSLIASLMNKKITYPTALSQAHKIDPLLNNRIFKTIILVNEITLKKITSPHASVTATYYHSQRNARKLFKIARKIAWKRQRFHQSRSHRPLLISTYASHTSMTSQALPSGSVSIDAGGIDAVRAFAAPTIEEFPDLQ